MFRAFLWKEFREQAPILIALLVLGGGVIAVATTLGSSAGSDANIWVIQAYTNAGRLSVLALAVAAGVVIGGSLFAGERENDTFENLEMLPTRRLKIWWGKFIAGLVLMICAGFILLGMGLAMGALGSTAPMTWFVWGFLLVFIAFSWGVFGSTLCNNTLTACGVGLVLAVVLSVPIFGVSLGLLREIILQVYPADNFFVMELAVLVSMYNIGLFPLLFAAAIFTHPDRARKPIVDEVIVSPRTAIRQASRSGGVFSSLISLFWLTLNQWWIYGPLGVVLCLIAGLICLHPEVHFLIVWPGLSLFVGVMSGVLSWSDEQHKETYKYWGERRLPLTRMWLSKVVSGFAMAIFSAVMILLPTVIRHGFYTEGNQATVLTRVVGSAFLANEVWEQFAYLLLWVGYGWAFGHLTGVVFPKTIVAIGVGVLTAGPFAVFWFPALLTGGLRWWQPMLVPVLVVLTTRLLLRAWTTSRMGTKRPLTLLAILLVTALGWYGYIAVNRYREIERAPEIDDDLRFADTVPQLDFEDGGRAYRGTYTAFEQAQRDFPGRRTNRAVPDHFGVDHTVNNYLQWLAFEEWPVDEIASQQTWYDRRSVEELAKNLKEAAWLPPGPIENPRSIQAFSLMKEAGGLNAVASLLIARGLSKQAIGKPVEFVDCLEAVLAMSRNARTQQPAHVQVIGFRVEWMALRGLNQFLERPGVTPESLHEILCLLQQHENTCPKGTDAFLTERMIARNTLVEFSQWAPQQLSGNLQFIDPQRPPELLIRRGNVESELIAFALTLPWEQERMRRQFGRFNNPANTATFSSDDGVNQWLGARLFEWSNRSPVTVPLSASQAHTRVAMAQVALTLYELEQGKPPQKLDDLVPTYLPEVPIDPYDGKPLRYRLSKGERIEWGVRNLESRRIIPQIENIIPDEERELHGAFLGGIAFADRPLDIAPGIDASGNTKVNFDAAAAVVGGIVQWPLEPLENPGQFPFAGMGGPGGNPQRQAAKFGENGAVLDEKVWRDVQAGRGVVWSIGTDSTDDHGELQCPNWNTIGDLLRVVPRVKPPK